VEEGETLLLPPGWGLALFNERETVYVGGRWEGGREGGKEGGEQKVKEEEEEGGVGEPVCGWCERVKKEKEGK